MPKGDEVTTIHNGDCIEVMNQMPPESVDAIVTDPPYGLGFMGKKWDGLPPSLEWAEACYRVLRPGGHIAAFGGTRTWHRLAVAIEDAGFEMRDSLAWLYGSGFPKSMNVGKAVDKAAGVKREVIGSKIGQPGYHLEPGGKAGEAYGSGINGRTADERLAASQITAPATPEAAQWDGWGTALKPAFEPIVLARKPLAEKTVARNVLAHGTGAINVDACRIATEENLNGGAYAKVGNRGVSASLHAGSGMNTPGKTVGTEYVQPSGRWPANVLLDQHAAAWVDEQSGITQSPTSTGRGAGGQNGMYSPIGGQGAVPAPGDKGGASRFFYSAKAPKRERPNVDGVQHATVKPLAIMRWLIRLVTPPGGTVLDPFAGSGTTIEAALIEGFEPVGIELEAEYLPLIQHRIDRQAAHAAERHAPLWESADDA